jgi:two-component system, chemotaxis family, chemotaxis protein CheY
VKPLSVLIVDDSLMMRTFIQRILVAAGFEEGPRHQARNGNEALDVLHRCPVDLVISDINMPDLDGEGLVRSLAGDEALRRIPILMVSSDSTVTRAERLLALGAAGYLVKPFHPEELKTEIDRILEEHHA